MGCAKCVFTLSSARFVCLWKGAKAARPGHGLLVSFGSRVRPRGFAWCLSLGLVVCCFRVLCVCFGTHFEGHPSFGGGGGGGFCGLESLSGLLVLAEAKAHEHNTLLERTRGSHRKNQDERAQERRSSRAPTTTHTHTLWSSHHHNHRRSGLSRVARAENELNCRLSSRGFTSHLDWPSRKVGQK